MSLLREVLEMRTYARLTLVWAVYQSIEGGWLRMHVSLRDMEGGAATW